MINRELLDEIKTTLGQAIAPILTDLSTISDIFEAYVFSLILEAAKTEGAHVTFKDVFGNVPAAFVFRTSPGHIFSTIKPYTHALIKFSGKDPLEAHLGVKVVGQSGVQHECDVAVIRGDEAETCRQNKVPPRSNKLIIAAECKFYAAPLQLHLARAFIGLTSDLSIRKSVFVTNSYSESIEKLLSHKGKAWEHNLTPNASVEVARLRHKFQDAFQIFKAM